MTIETGEDFGDKVVTRLAEGQRIIWMGGTSGLRCPACRHREESPLVRRPCDYSSPTLFGWCSTLNPRLYRHVPSIASRVCITKDPLMLPLLGCLCLRPESCSLSAAGRVRVGENEGCSFYRIVRRTISASTDQSLAN